MHKVLMRLLTETVLQYSTLLLSDRRGLSIDILKNIYKCACFFKEMSFSEPLQVSCFRVTCRVASGLLSYLEMRI